MLLLLAKNGRKYEFFAITRGAQGRGPSFLEAEDREAVPEAPQWVAVHVTLPEEETQRCYTWGESRCPDFKISVNSCLYNYNGSFAFSFYFILSLRQDGMLRKRLTKKDERMRPKMRELHELPREKNRNFNTNIWCVDEIVVYCACAEWCPHQKRAGYSILYLVCGGVCGELRMRWMVSRHY